MYVLNVFVHSTRTLGGLQSLMLFSSYGGNRQTTGRGRCVLAEMEVRAVIMNGK